MLEIFFATAVGKKHSGWGSNHQNINFITDVKSANLMVKYDAANVRASMNLRGAIGFVSAKINSTAVFNSQIKSRLMVGLMSFLI